MKSLDEAIYENLKYYLFVVLRFVGELYNTK